MTKETIICLILFINCSINQSVYANADIALDEFPEQELYIPDEPEYYEDEYYYDEELYEQPIDSVEIIESTVKIDDDTTIQPVEHEEVEPTAISEPVTTVVADLEMVMQENNAEFLGYFFNLATPLPIDAKIVSAQLVFVNSKNNQKIVYPYRIYVEKAKNPARLSLENLVSQRMDNVTTSFGVYQNNAQWAEGARWEIDVTTPIQELSYKQLLDKQLVLIAENNTTSHQFFNYTLNEYVVSLEIKIAGIHRLEKSIAAPIEFDSSILAAINAIPTGMFFEYENNQLVAEIEGVKFAFAIQAIALSNTHKAKMDNNAQGQVVFTTATGYTITTTPVIQDIPALRTALDEFGLLQWHMNQMGSIEVALKAGTFLFRPAMSSEPVTQLPQGIQMQGNIINFVFTDEEGQLRQQLLYPVAAEAEYLLKTIRMLPHTSQVKIDEMGYVSFNLADKVYKGLLSYQLDMSDYSVRTGHTVGMYALPEDVNADGEIDYQIIYDNKKSQLLTSTLDI